MHRLPSLFVLALFATSVAAAQGEATLPRLVAAELEPAPWNVQSGGIVAYDVSLDETGKVVAADLVQDVRPYGAQLGDALPSWRFEPARERGNPVRSRVLVLGFFRPPGTTFAAPESPRYKSTVAPAEIPWPIAVVVPPYPPNALGSGKVVLEVDVSEAGKVAGLRVLSVATPFDGAAQDTARQWRFRPASRGNREMASRAVLVFSFVGTTP